MVEEDFEETKDDHTASAKKVDDTKTDDTKMDPNQSMTSSPQNNTAQFSTKQVEDALINVKDMEIDEGPAEFRVEKLNDESRSQL